ncbi:hypothetical protein LWI29_029220 [Acer saccharum]|uniref:Uncharacterized protein n=1 Tax=Acer saccharum TaxID=4024 RepID=A0AA39SJ60_ACESA|nr:hypothetical protein LWI29_029220 [Acer saccharum]
MSTPVEEPGLDQKDRCHGREAPMSPSPLDQGRNLHEHISSSSSAKMPTLAQQDSNQSSPIGTPTGNICPHPSFSDPSVASWSSSHLSGDNYSFHADQQTKGTGRSQISSSLQDEEAFFMELDSILDKSPKDLLDFSSCTILATSQQINHAKRLLQQCLSTNFESLIHSFQRDQINSSLEKLSKVGHFPSSMINTVRTFRVNFLVNTDVYLKCKENIKRADKSKKEGMVLREELANNRSRFNKLVGDIWIVADEMRVVDEIEELFIW